MIGALTTSGSGVEPGLYSPCQHEREGTRSALKYYANIEEMMADGGFGFHAKVK